MGSCLDSRWRPSGALNGAILLADVEGKGLRIDRLSEDGEHDGLDIHEHGISAYPEYVISALASPAGAPLRVPVTKRQWADREPAFPIPLSQESSMKMIIAIIRPDKFEAATRPDFAPPPLLLTADSRQLIAFSHAHRSPPPRDPLLSRLPRRACGEAGRAALPELRAALSHRGRHPGDAGRSGQKGGLVSPEQERRATEGPKALAAQRGDAQEVQP